jgi:hypothetical protein
MPNRFAKLGSFAKNTNNGWDRFISEHGETERWRVGLSKITELLATMRTIELVGMNGSIDWCCHPHFDSSSIFGAILDDKKGGQFHISAAADGVRHRQFYWLYQCFGNALLAPRRNRRVRRLHTCGTTDRLT